MLYVFHVDMGRMMKFDMTVALSSVENLKDTIERLHGIQSSNIVLLVSGGEMLTKSTQVSYYSAGTDTNPIYMFLTGEEAKQPLLIPNVEQDGDLKEQVERSLTLPAVYETVVSRAQLAQHMYELAREEEAICERLVHEQHLQQQGWSAVVANMEDLTEEFRQRFENFCISFNGHFKNRAKFIELLKNFGDDQIKLSKIPILPGLMQLAEEDFHGFDALLDNDEVFSQSKTNVSVIMAHDDTDEESNLQSTADKNSKLKDCGGDDKRDSTTPSKKPKMGDDDKLDTNSIGSGSSATKRTLTLLQWISAKENNDALKIMSEECIQGLGTFDESIYEKLKSEISNIIRLAEQGDVKEIKGLGERLCKLEEFKYKIKNMVQDQKELATAFQQNQNRAINLRDASILPDLCASHQSQMLVMLQNQQKIRDHRRCISKAKDELGANLHTRLKRIVLIENAMSEFDNRLLFYHRCLRRAERHINIIEQIHQAPCIYVAAVTEVVRRKIFSGEFHKWASKLAEDFDSIHNEEINRRRIFNSNFEGHFLNILFPGMNDMPPSFASENPIVFDARLPNITKNDIDILTSHLPDITSNIQLPDMEPVINFFISRAGSKHLEKNINEIEICDMNLPHLSHQRVIEIQNLAKDGCESETDTEEFEKVVGSEVCQAVKCISTSTTENICETMDVSTATDKPQTQSIETLTEENFNSLRRETERLKEILRTMSQLSFDCIQIAKTNIDQLKVGQKCFDENIHSEIEILKKKLSAMQMLYNSKELYIEEISKDYQSKILHLEKNLENKDEELKKLEMKSIEKENNCVQKIVSLEANCETLQTQCCQLEQQNELLKQQLEDTKIDKGKAIAEAEEKLIHEHKSEIESLRCRFKLMTSMERSPSDTSLEKIEKPDMVDIAYHESIVAQIRNEFLSEKDSAVKKAIETERSLWQSKVFPLNTEVITNVCILKEMLEDKEKQLDILREKDIMMTKENYQLKTRLDALINEEGNSWLQEKIMYLNRDKSRLEEELVIEKCRRSEMEASFAALKGSTIEQTSALSRSKSSGSSHKQIVLESCSKGDLVFVVWSVRHNQFMVVQDSPNLYFVHGDSLNNLNLKLPSSDETGIMMPPNYYALGRVIEKEYCQARKDENRYRVTRGSKFYRIKLAPLTRSESKWSNRRERLESSSSSASISRSISQTDTTDGVTCSYSLTRPLLELYPSDTPTTSKITPIDFKERTTSICNVTEEDDEPLSLLGETCPCVNNSEEEDCNRTSVITEQPTTNKIDIASDLQTSTLPLAAACSCYAAISDTALNTVDRFSITTAAATTTSISVSIADYKKVTDIDDILMGKDAEDSDEYRSLESKDNTDFTSGTEN